MCVLKLVCECVCYFLICKIRNGPHDLLQLHLHYACLELCYQEIRIYALWGLSWMSKALFFKQAYILQVKCITAWKRFCIHFDWLQYLSYPLVTTNSNGQFLLLSFDLNIRVQCGINTMCHIRVRVAQAWLTVMVGLPNDNEGKKSQINSILLDTAHHHPRPWRIHKSPLQMESDRPL